MPLYEFSCARCLCDFEEVVRDLTTRPDCPKCGQSDEVGRIPFARVSVGKKDDLSPPNIKGTRRPRRR
jgi:putative FmdB family regulatory protein